MPESVGYGLTIGYEKSGSHFLVCYNLHVIHHKGLKNTWKANRRILSICISTRCGMLHMNKGLHPWLDAERYGQKNKPTTLINILVGLEHISSPFVHVECSTYKL